MMQKIARVLAVDNLSFIVRNNETFFYENETFLFYCLNSNPVLSEIKKFPPQNRDFLSESHHQGAK